MNDYEKDIRNLMKDYWIIYNPVDDTNGYIIKPSAAWSPVVRLYSTLIENIENNITFTIHIDNEEISKIYELSKSDTKLSRELLLGIYEESKVTTSDFLHKLKSIYEKGV